MGGNRLRGNRCEELSLWVPRPAQDAAGMGPTGRPMHLPIPLPANSERCDAATVRLEAARMSSGFTYDFFVSRRGPVAAQAQQVADILIGEGYKVVVQDFDFASSGHFVLDIDRALKQSQHLLILYSHDYDTNFWTQQEFANFQAARSGDEQRQIRLLRCDDAVPDGLLAGITHGVLTGVSDPGEQRRIVLAVAEGRTPTTRASPRVFGGTMPLENRLFTGRDDLLAAMHAALASNAAAALTQTAVHGLGGVGKTSLAREYIRLHAGDYSGGVWWITASDPSRTADGFAELARVLLPGLPIDIPAAEAARAVLAELDRREAPFLLIYDNAPDPAALAGLLPKRGPKVLITSRHPGWNRQAVPLAVNELAEDAAVALLQSVAGRAGQDDAGARRLARELGCLPLALDQAGAYVRETLVSFDDYAAQVAVLLRRLGDNPDYPDSVAATFDLAIARAAERAPAAEDALGLFAWVAPEQIPLALLDLPTEARAESLAALRSLSLVSLAVETAAGLAVTVHRLVQAVMRDRLAAKGVAEASRSLALHRFAGMFPYAFNEPTHWPLCRVLLPHTYALVARLTPDDQTPELPLLLNRVGNCLGAMGDAGGALPLYRRALERNERVLGLEHAETLATMNNLAHCLQTMGDAAAALPLHRRALENCKRVLGAEHPDTLLAVNNLASCLQTLGSAPAALALFRWALESSERVLGAEHPGTLLGVNNLAGCLQTLDDAAAALPLFRRALESSERVLGAEHPDTLSSVNNLAHCLETLGDPAAALPLRRRALESSERVLGAEHPQTLTSVNNLASCLQTLGDDAAALPLYRRALESRERGLGAEHPQTLTSVNNLAYCLRALGDPAAALPLYRRALAGMQRLYGQDHPSTRTIKANLDSATKPAGPYDAT
jgi:tetratricopeptide (TPR) repeat protein